MTTASGSTTACIHSRDSIDTLRVNDFPCARLITFNRPASHNAISLEMVQHMLFLHRLRPHAHLGRSALYILKGAGERSFCAGGDVINVIKNENLTSFLKQTYSLYFRILTMPNPQVSLWNGYVMGGGVGISIHGKYRVASERATLAMPETLIGMFPDNGMTYIFPRVPVSGLGLYLGLTGARIKGADLVHAGLATHFVPSEEFVNLENRLCTIEDPRRIEACLDEFAVRDLPPFSLDKHRAILEKAFTLKDTTTVEGIIESLSNDNSEFALEAKDALAKASPMCLKITVELMRRAIRMKTMREVMTMELNVVERIDATNEFTRGVTARMVHKTEPRWDPPTLEEVTPSYVEEFFNADGLSPWDPDSE